MNTRMNLQMSRNEFARTLGGAASDTNDAVVICEGDTKRFREQFADAAGTRGPVFLANPDWGGREREQFDAVVDRRADDWDPELGWLMIPTGGSSGAIKLARHDQHTIMAAVIGYQEFCGADRVDGVGMLPLHHVGGLMGWLRCALTGGQYCQLNWREISLGNFPVENLNGIAISLVPTQLQALRGITGGVDWLRQFGSVFIGGAALTTDLCDWARENNLPLSLSYGLTESMAMVCAMSPQDFLAGVEGVGAPLPHIELMLGEGGEIKLKTASLFRGYWPDHRRQRGAWATGDLGEWDSAGRLTVKGRQNDLIVSGGEKINPAEVEAAVKQAVGLNQIAVLGVADAHWGQVAMLVYCAERTLELTELRGLLDGELAKFKWPKRVVKLDSWPVNSVGKVDRRCLRRLAGD